MPIAATGCRQRPNDHGRCSLVEAEGEAEQCATNRTARSFPTAACVMKNSSASMRSLKGGSLGVHERSTSLVGRICDS